MLNSRSYSREDGVINIGEEIASDVNLKDPATRIYYHQVKGAVTHMPDGAQITFRGGMYATQNAEVISYLDKIANKRGSLMYTKDEDRKQFELERAVTISDARVPAGSARASIGTGDDGKLVAITVDETAALERVTSGEETSKLVLKPGVKAALQQ